MKRNVTMIFPVTHRMASACVLLLFAGLVPLNAQPGGAAAKRLNVVLIVADDMGMGDLSCTNGGRNKTPVLDEMVSEGVWFDRAYSASPVCAPARAALLTGSYPHRTGVVTLNMHTFPDLTRLYRNQTTLADVFRANGYATALIGKWHLGRGADYHPLKRGFDEFIGFSDTDITTYFDYKLDVNGTYTSKQSRYLTEALTDHAVDFIRRHPRSPFFLNVAYHAPHRPLGAPEKLVSAYRKQGFDEKTATIYAMIEVMDSGIGALLHALDAAGIRENTLVIFTSDNGPDPLAGERFNQRLEGTKYTVYEGGIRVPLLFNWRGRISPSTNHEVVHFTDLFPTLVDLLDLGIPADLRFDGGSIRNLIFNEGVADLPGARYWQWNRGVPFYSHNAAMLEGEWKLVRPYVTRDIPQGESKEKAVLYNLRTDPYETTDRADEFPKQYDRMQVMLENWSRQMEFDRNRNRE